MSSTDSAQSAVAASLAQCAINTSPAVLKVQTSQLVHRLNLLSAFFPSHDYTETPLAGSTVLEIGCGQGDTTIVLAHAVGSGGKVFALDPAPLDYGSPYTLEQAQGHLSASKLGDRIEWIRADPLEAAENGSLDGKDLKWVVLAHSLFYMSGEDYVYRLLKALADYGKKHGGLELLFAEWGMKTSVPGAEAHLLAVKAQSAQPLRGGNVQMSLEPAKIAELAKKAGWVVEREAWVEAPQMDDGDWEVSAAKSMDKGESTREAKALLEKMEESIQGPVECMDVWTGMFSA
ncbi:hypothetical protein B0A48_16003 [Cryoendolithus antarcticus]|uniref:Methyltransferase domain-containing protein n=1 Tax=Cryoendolithus antarcticus TaxID=1507870 RepID=A0A1V8SH63_9PEZI|nr:hypothetical protein B0A48_16003 [Cryoendolithus antarcticus]